MEDTQEIHTGCTGNAHKMPWECTGPAHQMPRKHHSSHTHKMYRNLVDLFVSSTDHLAGHPLETPLFTISHHRTPPSSHAFPLSHTSPATSDILPPRAGPRFAPRFASSCRAVRLAHAVLLLGGRGDGGHTPPASGLGASFSLPTSAAAAPLPGVASAHAVLVRVLGRTLPLP